MNACKPNNSMNLKINKAHNKHKAAGLQNAIQIYNYDRRTFIVGLSALESST